MSSLETQSKLRGGYYTPEPIADFLVEWAIDSPTAHVLEPSAGDGVFVQAVAKRINGQGTVDAVELDLAEAKKIRDRTPQANVVAGDAFDWYTHDRDGMYDAVVGNPPFIRYQTFPEAHRAGGFSLMRLEGMNPNGLTNAWVPFVALATRALKEGGRLALVLPAELLQVSYAGELRGYLARTYSELTIVTFRRLVFDGIQQETVLLLGVRSDDEKPSTISLIELDTGAELSQRRATIGERVGVDLNHRREKWTQYYLSRKELGLIREIEQSDAFTPLGNLAEVDVGIVTGRNAFFVLTPSEAKTLGLEEFCIPLVGRSAQIPGLSFDIDDWQDLAGADSRCLLLQLGRTSRSELSAAALAYVEKGEAAGYHTGYKCRIRLPEWWYVPSTAVPDAFLLRQIHDGPRIIVNTSEATCTDTIHRVRVRDDIDPGWLAAASMNSVTFAFSEIRGRSYGGGVLELEPTEAEGLPFPRPTGVLPLAELDLWARRKDAEQVLAEVDRQVLVGSGLTQSEIEQLRDVWRKLAARRMARKRR